MGVRRTKDGVLRVVVSIREDTRPDLVSGPASGQFGQGRAELVRAHLASPYEYLVYKDRRHEKVKQHASSRVLKLLTV